MKMKQASKPKRWMIVDDDDGALSLTREIVLKLGITQINCFNNAPDALAAFEANPESFELVITDFQMPGMDGVELSRHMLSRSPKIKILLMTGSGLITNNAVVRDGLCALLQKPFSFAALQ